MAKGTALCLPAWVNAGEDVFSVCSYVCSSFCLPSFLSLEVFLLPPQLYLKPALDLLPLGFKQFLVAVYLENRIESAVDGGRVLAHGLAELGDIVLHFILIRRRDGGRRQSREDVGDQAGDRLQPFQAIFDAGAPGFDFHLLFQDRLHAYIILVTVGKRSVVPLERDTTSRSPLEEAFLFRQGTAAYPAPLLLQPDLDFLKAFV